MNYFEDFLNMIDSEYLNDLLKVTPGIEKAEKTITEINNLIKHDQVLKEKIALCLSLQQELWFNVGWSAGWTAGAVTIAKMTGIDSPAISKIAKTLNYDPD
jgi:hypothetical protein